MKRSKSIYGDGAEALTPNNAPSAVLTERIRAENLANLLKLERRRHASVESVLTKHINSLEHTIEFLKGVITSTASTGVPAMKGGPHV